jgi:hypothetical protein
MLGRSKSSVGGLRCAPSRGRGTHQKGEKRVAPKILTEPTLAYSEWVRLLEEEESTWSGVFSQI